MKWVVNALAIRPRADNAGGRFLTMFFSYVVVGMNNSIGSSAFRCLRQRRMMQERAR